MSPLVFLAEGKLGAWSLILCLGWLAGAALAGVFAMKADRPEKYGIGTGLLLPIVGALIWLVIWIVSSSTRRSGEVAPPTSG